MGVAQQNCALVGANIVQQVLCAWQACVHVLCILVVVLCILVVARVGAQQGADISECSSHLSLLPMTRDTARLIYFPKYQRLPSSSNTKLWHLKPKTSDRIHDEIYLKADRKACSTLTY